MSSGAKRQRDRALAGPRPVATSRWPRTAGGRGPRTARSPPAARPAPPGARSGHAPRPPRPGTPAVPSAAASGACRAASGGEHLHPRDGVLAALRLDLGILRMQGGDHLLALLHESMQLEAVACAQDKLKQSRPAKSIFVSAHATARAKYGAQSNRPLVFIMIILNRSRNYLFFAGSCLG